MFEFKLNTHTGQWVLLEVNARPWGSLPLPMAWGVDFPYRLYQLLCQQQATPPVPYPPGRFNRNLIGDIWQMRVQVAQLKKQPARLGVVLLRWMLGFGRILLLREKHDVWVADDPAPAWTEIKQFVAQRVPKSTSVDLALGQANAALVKLIRQKTGHILFICQGNICRSPYAEVKARSVLRNVGLSITVDSAGMLPRNRRPSPAVAIAAAKSSGVDLDDHLSKCTDTDLVSKADLIFIFDEVNCHSFKQRHPDQVGKLVLLSEFDDKKTSNFIADPDGKSIFEFQNTYEVIQRCINNFAQKIIKTV